MVYLAASGTPYTLTLQQVAHPSYSSSTPFILTLEQVAHPIEYTLTQEQVAHPAHPTHSPCNKQYTLHTHLATSSTPCTPYSLTLQQVAHPIHSLQDPIRSPPSVKHRPRFMHTPSEFLEKLNVLLFYVTLNHDKQIKNLF